MKLDKLLGITEEDLFELGYPNIDFSSDIPFFVDLEKLIQDEYFMKYFDNNTQNVTDAFINKLTGFATTSRLSEPKYWGLGLSQSSRDGRGPELSVINNILMMLADENKEYSLELSNLFPMINGFGPDGLSDINLLVFEDILSKMSNKSIDHLIHLYPALKTHVSEGIDGYKKIKVDGVSRKILPSSVLSSFRGIQAFYGQISYARNFKSEADTPAHQQFLQAVLRGKLSRENLAILKVLKKLSGLDDIGRPIEKTHAIFKKTSSLYSMQQFIKLECDKKINAVIEDASRSAWTLGAKNIEDPSSIKEESYQRLFQSYLMGVESHGSIDGMGLYVESNVSTGAIEFIIQACDTQYFIELKSSKITPAKGIEWIDQLKRYSESKKTSLKRKRFLVIYTDQKGYDKAEKLINKKDVESVEVFGPNNAPSSGKAKNPPKKI